MPFKVATCGTGCPVTDHPACPYLAALAPVCAQPDGGPREGVLQQFPWIYRVSALEGLRQVALEAPPSPASPALAFREADAESTAVKLPGGTTEADVTGLAIRVLEPLPQPLEVALVRAFFLDAAYRPRPSFIPPGVWRLRDGQ